MLEVNGFALEGFDWKDYNFNLKEFVDPKTYAKWGAAAIWQIDIRLVPIVQALRDYFKQSVTINDWAWGGKYQFSGYRPTDCKTGAPHSQHRRGCAVDPKIKNVSPIEVRAYIRTHFYDVFKPLGLTTIERNTKTWTHMDNRHTGMSELLEVNG